MALSKEEIFVHRETSKSFADSLTICDFTENVGANG